MRLQQLALLSAYRIISRVLYGDAAYADWIFEKMQRPGSCFVAAGNVLNYTFRRPRISGLLTIVLEPVFACNLRCEYCWGLLERLPGIPDSRPKLMEWDIFERILECAPRSVETITLGGNGEPLMHPRFDEMLTCIASKGRRPHLYTNGTLLEGERLDRLARAPLAVLNISMEPDEKSAREVRGVDLSQVRENVRAFIARKRPETEVKLSVVAHAGNVDALPNAWHEWEGLVSHIKITPVFGLEGTGGPVRCMEPWRGNVNIQSGGNVNPCCWDAMGDLIIGNIMEQPLDEIIRAPRMRALLASFISGQSPDRCNRCSQFKAPRIPVRAPGATGVGRDQL